MIVFENYFLDCLLRLAASFLCGMCLGIERKMHQRMVGMRTLILISTSTTLLCMLSVSIALNFGGGDPTRIAAAVVTGIGFLGGGAILRQGLNIRGLTSAAIIWTAAALGIACGAGCFFIAGVVLAISLLSLVLLERVEWRFFPAEKTKFLTIVYSGHEVDLARIQKDIAESGLVRHDLNMSEFIVKERIVLKFSVKAPGEFDVGVLARKLMQSGNLVRISISDD
ncbi:MAG: MgtC/SapB family protein [Treponemataceae bacterium]|nr:MgtC/SapB family protein [Treponemataceae bacterium]